LSDLTFLYNGNMVNFRYYQPVKVRYGDPDPQGHVNNDRFVVCLEHARFSCHQDLGLWDGRDLLGLGFNLVHLIAGRVAREDRFS